MHSSKLKRKPVVSYNINIVVEKYFLSLNKKDK